MPILWDDAEARFCTDVTDYKDMKQPYEDKHYWPLRGNAIAVLQTMVIGNIYDNRELMGGEKDGSESNADAH